MAASGSSSRLLAIGGVVFAIGVLLVLFLVRGGDDGPAAAPAPSPTTTADDTPTDAETEDTVVVQPGVTAKVQIPADLELADGTEAVAIDVTYLRGVAGLPSRGDLVRLYWLPSVESQSELQPVDRNRDGQPDLDEDGRPVLDYTGPLPAATPLDLDLEVLAVIGSQPTVRGGASTLVFGVPSDRVAEILAMVNANELWVTLLPSDEEG